MDNNEIFGKQLRKQRMKMGYTQATLAQAMTNLGGGVHEKSIAAWERGEGCKTAYIPVLCQILDCDTEYLFGNSFTPHKEIESASSTTGLSVKAIEVLQKIKSTTITTDDNPYLVALNSLLESKHGDYFLSELFFYLYGDYKWATLCGEDVEGAGVSCRLDCDGFNFEIFDKSSWCHEGFDRNGFMQMIRNSKMAKLQELLIEIRKEAEKGALAFVHDPKKDFIDR